VPEGRWTAIEIKLGAHEIDEAASKLLALQRDMQDYPRATPPSVLCAVCGMRYDRVYIHTSRWSARRSNHGSARLNLWIEASRRPAHIVATRGTHDLRIQ
jgi:hypothetical protein